MTGPISPNILDKEQDKFVESPTRLNKTAIEVFVGNAIAIVPASTSAAQKSQYSEVLGVVSGITTSVLLHACIVDTILYGVSASGENIAEWELLVDSVLLEKKRTYFGGSLNTEFLFPNGYFVAPGKNIEITVVHLRPSTASFNATLKYSESL